MLAFLTFISISIQTHYLVALAVLSQTILVLKYVLKEYSNQFTYYGYANVSQNVALMLSAVILWIAQNTSGEYEYNLTL